MKKNTKIDEIVEALKTQIEQGIYVSGQRLPSERSLAEDYQVSRSTIRAAMLRLQAENLVDIVPRGGIFVRSSAPKLPLIQGPELQQIGSFIHLMRLQGRDVLVRYIEPSKVIPAGKDIGEKLNIKGSTPVLKRYRIQLIDRVPYRILVGYYLASLTGELEGQEGHNTPLFEWLWKTKKFKATRVTEKLQCRMPTEEEANNLNIARNQPVVEMHRWIFGKYQDQEKEIPFEFSKIICNAALHEFQYTYHIQDEALK